MCSPGLPKLLCGYEISTIYLKLRLEPDYVIQFSPEMIMKITDFARFHHIGPEWVTHVRQDTGHQGLWMQLLELTGLVELSIKDSEFNIRVMPQFSRLFEGVVKALDGTGITQGGSADRKWQVPILHAWATHDRQALEQWVKTHLYPVRNPVFQPPQSAQAASVCPPPLSLNHGLNDMC
jgi:hypothetical protein